MNIIRYKRFVPIVTIIISVLIGCSFVVTADSNPIPLPTIILEHEYITIEISKVHNKLDVTVFGHYPFKNYGYKDIMMYFPIPPEALDGNISVFIDGKPIEWDIVWSIVVDGKNKSYTTVLGDYPLLKWHIKNVPDKFTVSARYEYIISSEKGVYKILYAMATGRFFDYYAKQCTAEVKIIFRNLNSYEAKITLTPPPNQYPGKTSFKYIIKGDHDEIEIVEQSDPFRGLDRDLLIEIYGREAEKWIPAKPMDINIKLDKEDNTTLTTVIMTFNHAGYKVDWEACIIKDKVINIYTDVYMWTGPSAQVITEKKNTYKLVLTPGEYTLNVYVNGQLMKKFIINIGNGENNQTNNGNSNKSDDLQAANKYIIGISILLLAIAIFLAYFLGGK